MHARLGLSVAMLLVVAFALGCSKEDAAEKAASDAVTVAPLAHTGAPSGMPLPVRPSPTAELPDPIVTMKTSLGDIMLRLNQKQAPRTVSNFVDYIMTRHYDGTIFHQIDAGYVVLGGTFTDKLHAKTVRYPIPNESANGLKNRRGTIAMARNLTDPNSATSQFFINLADNPQLDRKGDRPEDAGFCVFGEVIQGLDVLEKIAEVRTATVQGFEKLPVQTVMLHTVSVVR